MDSQISTSTTWPTFLTQFGPQFDEVCRIVTQLHAMPEQLSQMEITLPPAEQLAQSQQDWLKEYDELSDPLDKEFYKPWWVKLSGSENIFIDLLDPNYGIFAARYYCIEPYQRYKRYVVRDVYKVLESPETGFDIRAEMSVNYKTMWRLLDEFYEERQKLAFAGKLELEHELQITDKLLFGKRKKARIEADHKQFFVKITNVSAHAMGLFPHQLPVKIILKSRGKKISNQEGHAVLGKVPNLKGWLYFLRQQNLTEVTSMHIYSLAGVFREIRYNAETLRIWFETDEAMVRFLGKLQGVEPELPIPVDPNVIEDEDGNVIYPPSENAVRLPDEFMPDWYQERMERINNPDNAIDGFEISNE